jgi:hypothetical protein
MASVAVKIYSSSMYFVKIIKPQGIDTEEDHGKCGMCEVGTGSSLNLEDNNNNKNKFHKWCTFNAISRESAAKKITPVDKRGCSCQLC